MFTGLVQDVGTLQTLDPEHVEITCSEDSIILQGLELGDSVAVDGVCLTVVKILPIGFIADVSPETMRRTALGRSEGRVKRVNLETSLRIGSKLGGHFVTGHVDGVGYFQSAVQAATSWDITFTTESDTVARYILSKGSVAVNGISLTVADCNLEGTSFSVAVIPHTYTATNLCHLQPGSWVNLEGDILGKYVEKFLRSDRTASNPPLGSRSGNGYASHDAAISTDFLAEHGYL